MFKRWSSCSMPVLLMMYVPAPIVRLDAETPLLVAEVGLGEEGDLVLVVVVALRPWDGRGADNGQRRSHPNGRLGWRLGYV